MFIREGSLKAQKMEMEAQKAELEEQDKAKNEKRSRSAGGKKVRPIIGTNKDTVFTGHFYLNKCSGT